MGRRKAPQPPAPAASGPSKRRRKLDPPPADCISTLPDDLLREIILLLPMKDGGRTQALASRWRHLWRSIPLDLDCSDFLPHKNSLLTSLALVSSVLSAHPGPGRRFCVPPLCPSATVDKWLRCVALDNLEELDLGGKAGFLHQLLASTFRFSDTLRVASITSYIIPDAAVEGLFFPRLKQLGLVGVHVSERSLHGLIAGCPSLESLAVRRGSGFCRLLINSLALRSIAVQIAEPKLSTPPDLQFGELVIQNAPSLERELEVMKFQIPAKIYNDKFLAQQHSKLQLEYKASSGAQFHFTTASYQQADWRSKHLHDFDLNDPFLGGF
ncbi:unnamed protein product [Alopecurus aequalis]